MHTYVSPAETWLLGNYRETTLSNHPVAFNPGMNCFVLKLFRIRYFRLSARPLSTENSATPTIPVSSEPNFMNRAENFQEKETREKGDKERSSSRGLKMMKVSRRGQFRRFKMFLPNRTNDGFISTIMRLFMLNERWNWLNTVGKKRISKRFRAQLVKSGKARVN